MKIKSLFRKSKEVREEKKEEVSKTKPETLTKPTKLATVELKGDHFSFGVIKSPHITEKASGLNALSQYVFKVFTRANKIQVKKAVQQLYGVKVEGVRILTMPSKKRKLGRFEGEKSGFKKAIVKLAEGQKIDIVPK